MKQIKLIILLFPFLLFSKGYSTTLKEAVESALSNNPEVLSLQKNSQAYKYYIDEEEAGYYPTIDLDIFIESKKEIKDPKDDAQTTVNKSGYNSQLQLEQMILDGGLTSAKVDEANADYQKTKISNIFTIENIIHEAVQSYLDIVKYKELLLLSENNIAIHQSYLEVAKESEDVSGESLDRIQVESKLFLAISKQFQQKNDNDVSLNSFYKLIGFEPKGNICRPVLDVDLIPTTVDEAKDESVRSSFTILEQIEAIKVQRAIISQENSRFLPTLKFQLREEFDSDLDTKNVKTNSTSAKFLLSYNLFNGFRDNASQERERVFLQESQKKLDDILNIVEEDIKSLYSDYLNSTNKITYLKLYVEKNKEILTVYKEQFSGGTRTFIDILNSEAELFNAKSQLIEEEYSLLKAYYEILLVLSKLSDTIVLQENQICEQIVVDLEPKPLEIKNEDEDSDLSELEGLLEDNSESDNSIQIEEDPEEKKQKEVKDLVADILSDIYEIKKTDKEIKKVIKATRKKKIEKTSDKKDEILIPNNKTNMNTFKQRFLAADDSSYTINLMTFASLKDANDFASSSEVLNDAFAFKFADNPNSIKLINGIYKSYDEALIELKKISSMMKSEIYIVDTIKNQRELLIKYSEYLKEPKKKEKVSEVILVKRSEKKAHSYKEIDNNAKAESSFMNAKDSDFVINTATYNSVEILESFVQTNNLFSKAFAFRFNENKKLIKLTYGVYSSRLEANNDLKYLSNIKNTNPVLQSAREIQMMYGLNDIQNSPFYEEEEEIESMDAIKEIRSVSNELIIDKLKSKEENNSSKIIAIVSDVSDLDKVTSLVDENVIEKDELSKNHEVENFNNKKEELQNSLAEEFSINKSNKYTYMILDFATKKRATTYAKRYGLDLDSVVFAFGSKYKLIHGVFDNFKEAQNSVDELHPFVLSTKPYVRKISGYQNLFNRYNKSLDDLTLVDSKIIGNEVERNEIQDIQKIEDIKEKKIIKNVKNVSEPKYNKSKTMLYSNINMKNEFLNTDSDKYTITLTTSPTFEEAKWFRYKHNIQNNTIVYKYRNKVKVIYGIFNSFKQAQNTIDNFEKELNDFKPFVNKVSTHQKLYKKYNKNIED